MSAGMSSNLWIIETISPRRSLPQQLAAGAAWTAATSTWPKPTASRLPKSCASSSLRSTSISTVGFSKSGSSMSRLADGDHGVGLAGALGVPDQAAALLRRRAPGARTRSTARIWCGRRTTLRQLVVLAGEEDEVGEHAQHAPRGDEGLDQRLEIARPASSRQLNSALRERFQVAP